MNRNEKIIKLLEDNGFVKAREDVYRKTVELKYLSYMEGQKVNIFANVYLDEEDMEDSSVEFNVKCSIDIDLVYLDDIFEKLNDCYQTLNALNDRIEDCKGDDIDE